MVSASPLLALFIVGLPSQHVPLPVVGPVITTTPFAPSRASLIPPGHEGLGAIGEFPSEAQIPTRKPVETVTASFSKQNIGPKTAVDSFSGRQTLALSSLKLSKWQDMSGRYSAQIEAGAEVYGVQGAKWPAWTKLAPSIPQSKLLSWANTRVNSIRYVPDRANWGREDYWATPLEFAQRGGDCEDYAIAKYKLLSLAGVSQDLMNVAVLDDHAVLLVQSQNGVVVLDNLRGKPYRLNRKISKRIRFTVNDRDWVLNFG